MAVTTVFNTNYRELSVNYHWIISFWVGTRCALKIVALRAKIGSFGGIVLLLLAEWKLVPYGQKSIKSKTNQTY